METSTDLDKRLDWIDRRSAHGLWPGCHSNSHRQNLGCPSARENTTILTAAASPLTAIAMVVVAISFSGCTEVGPDFKTPTAPVASTFRGVDEKPIPPQSAKLRDWWTVFNDPTLNHLIDTAYNQNLTLQSAGARVLEARAELGIATGNIYPQQQFLGGSVTYNRLSKSDIFAGVAPPPGNFWRATFGPEVIWELDFWGKFRRGIESADAAYLASIANYDDVLVTLLGDVATTYIGIRTLEQQIQYAKTNVATQRKALQIAETRFKEGSTTRLDVYQAQNVLGATEARLPQLEIQLEQGKNALRVLLGMAPQPLDSVMAQSTGIPAAPQDVALGIPADLLRRRPDIRVAEMRAAAQSAQIGVAKADLYPAFSLFGTVGVAATDVHGAELGDFFTSKGLTFAFGPSFHWNVLNYGQITNNVRVQDARLQALLIDYKNTVLTAQQEVENGVAGFVLSRQQAAYLRDSVKAAQGALDLSFLQYHEGLTDFTTVLQAEENLADAQNNFAATTGTESSSVAQIYRALGGGWEISAGKEFVTPETREEMVSRTDWGDALPTSAQAPPPEKPSQGFWHWLGFGSPSW